MTQNTNTTATTTDVAPLGKADVAKASFDLLAGVKAVAAQRATVRKADGTLMWNAALLMGVAIKRDVIKAEDKGGLFPTQGDYAAAAGYEKSMGTMLKRLSIAQGKGVKHGTALWTFLTQRATNGRVGAILTDETITDVTALGKALAPLMKENADTGKVSAAPKGAQETASEKDSEPTPEVRTVQPIAGDVLAALHALEVPVHGLSDADWAAVSAQMSRMVKAENARRALIAQGKSKKAEKVPAEVA